MEDRPTRWQKAKADWPGFHWWPDIGLALFGGLVAVGMLAVLGFPWKAILEVIVTVAAGAVAAALYRMAELAWAWLQAPMRLLTDDVVAIRERVEALPSISAEPQPEPAPNVRLHVLEYVRRAQLWVRRGRYYDQEVEAWAREAAEFLTNHGSEAEAERFLKASEIHAQIMALEKIAKDRSQ